MGVNSNHMNILPGQLISPTARRLNQVSPIRNAALLKVMDEIAKDQYFHIDGIKKGTEKDLIEKLYPDVCINDDGEMVVSLFKYVLVEINTIPHQ